MKLDDDIYDLTLREIIGKLKKLKDGVNWKLIPNECKGEVMMMVSSDGSGVIKVVKGNYVPFSIKLELDRLDREINWTKVERVLE